MTIQAQLRHRMKEGEAKRRLSVSSSDGRAISPQPTTSTAVEKEDSPYLRLAASSVGLTPLMRTGKPQVLEERPKLIGNLQKLSIFADKPRARLVKPNAMSIVVSSAMLEKENVQGSRNTLVGSTHGGMAAASGKSDRFKIENRLKSGAIKRPAPYNPK